MKFGRYTCMVRFHGECYRNIPLAPLNSKGPHRKMFSKLKIVSEKMSTSYVQKITRYPGRVQERRKDKTKNKKFNFKPIYLILIGVGWLCRKKSENASIIEILNKIYIIRTNVSIKNFKKKPGMPYMSTYLYFGVCFMVQRVVFYEHNN